MKGSKKNRSVLILCAGLCTAGVALGADGVLALVGLINWRWASLVGALICGAAIAGLLVWWDASLVEARRSEIDQIEPKTLTGVHLDYYRQGLAAAQGSRGLFAVPTMLDDGGLARMDAHLNELTGEIPRLPRGSRSGSTTPSHRTQRRTRPDGRNTWSGGMERGSA